MPATIPVSLAIRKKHIEKMLDAFDSGMCDQGRSNAICRAMKSELKLPSSLRVHFHNGHLEAFCRGEIALLPDEAGDWLQAAMTGLHVYPASFDLELPSSWFRRSAKLLSKPGKKKKH